MRFSTQLLDRQTNSRRKVIGIAVVMLFAFMTGMPAAQAQGTGYWHTSGNQIVDSSNHPVRIAAINWYGFETTDELAHGLWAQDYHTVLNTIKSNGYNTIRIPFSNQMVESPIIPSNLTFFAGTGPVNTDLKGLNSLQVLDKIVTAAGAIGLRVVLDNHRSEAGNTAEANGLWFTNTFPESAWIADWVTMVNRYSSFKDASGNPTVIGVDLRNEPHLHATSGPTGACWTGDTATAGCPATSTVNWPAAAQRAGNAVLGANSNLLVIVEGVDCYSGDCDWWGGNLEGVATNPVTLSKPNRLVYSAHDYGPVLFQQTWFNSSTTFTSLSANWTKFWGYVSANNIAPIWVGEFGTGNNATDVQNAAAGSQGQWFQSLVAFLQNNPNLSWAYWALNGEDSFALLDSQYDATPVSPLKQSLLASVQFPLNGGGGNSCPVPSSGPTNLVATAISSSQINLSWTGVAPPATGCTITYSVFRSTVSGFTPSTANQVASGLTATSFSNTGLVASTTYFFVVEAVDVTGATPSSQASGTTQAGGGTCTVAPATPTGLTAMAVSTSQINLSWTAVTPPANCTVTYSVFSSTTSGFIPSAANQVATGLTSPSFQNTGLTANTTYFFLVQAADGAGPSPTSLQASATTQQTTGTGGVTVTPVVVSSSAFFNEEDLKLANTAPLTALSITIVVQRTAGLSFGGQFNTAGSLVTQSNSSTTSAVTYTFTLGAGQTLSASNWTFAAQSSGNGTAHPTVGDTYTVTYTTGGQAFTQTGHF